MIASVWIVFGLSRIPKASCFTRWCSVRARNSIWGEQNDLRAAGESSDKFALGPTYTFELLWQFVDDV